MAPQPCAICKTARALIIRPKNHQKLCKACFISIFETEIHNTIVRSQLFRPGERIAIGASGGKDSTVLASVLKTLNERYDYGLELILLSIDEGIKGYRDDSLETVKRNAIQYEMPLTILGYDELYGWTMDQVVQQVGKKGNCTYCGVFRRQALDRGAAKLGIKHVVTGHNADDVAETVLMNLLRGDLPRLARATSIITASAASDIKRSKPLKYAYEKEIVLYAHHKKLDYFTTECIYSPEAFRGSARTLIKNLERLRPSAILDVVRSGEDMARLVPGESGGDSGQVMEEAEEGNSCGGGGHDRIKNNGGEMASLREQLRDKPNQKLVPTTTVITSNTDLTSTHHEIDYTTSLQAQNHDRTPETQPNLTSKPTGPAQQKSTKPSKSTNAKLPIRLPRRQNLQKCQTCGYLSSQEFCQACVLLAGLNKARPKVGIVDS